MKHLASPLSLALLSMLAAPAAHAGIEIGSIAASDISFEGQLQTDGYWYDSDFAGLDSDSSDGFDHDFGLRRAELVLKGKGPGNVEWVLGYDASGDGKFLDANVKYKISGSRNNYLQVGQYKQPNSMEELSSTKNNDFLSKAAITNTFAIGRRLGGSYTYGGDNWAVTGSAFGRELTRDRAHGSGLGARGYWAPINDKGSILHLGLSYVDYDTDADSLRYRVRPDADFANRIIDTGTFRDADRVSTIGLESFWVHGPFKLQGEYMSSKVDRHGTGSQDFTGTGGYVSGVWNITGETWKYKDGTPGTSLPGNPSAGMWQLGLRYDTLDLNDSGVLGGKMDTITAGVNYYWRSNFKVMVDYTRVNSERAGISDDPGILGVRVQFYW